MSQKIILYGTPSCPMVPPVRGLLNRAQAQFEYINIAQDETGAAIVMGINSGNKSVPTLIFPDGSTLTEPSINGLKTKLNGLGYKITAPSWRDSLVENPFTSILGAGSLLFGLFDGPNNIFVIIGIALLLLPVIQHQRNNR